MREQSYLGTFLVPSLEGDSEAGFGVYSLQSTLLSTRLGTVILSGSPSYTWTVAKIRTRVHGDPRPESECCSTVPYFHIEDQRDVSMAKLLKKKIIIIILLSRFIIITIMFFILSETTR
ncbi:hypothetical protein E2C01_032125 [Portunus trituberculatus]|uniref:Uncharacterized protein n=1 Tax=Portunus trituberculatus TaxID=210409 RepID=A0A5B7F1Z2_PORTR|nr:hypothetical protein [Portunus trituberculatus]